MSAYVEDRRVADSRPLFLELRKPPADKRRWGSLAASYAVQIVAMSALLIYTILAPRLEPALARHIALVAPDLTAPVKVAEVKPLPVARPQPLHISLPVPTQIQPPPVQLQQPQRVHRAVPAEEVAQPKLIAAPKFDSKLLKLPESKSLSKIVATNTFTGSSAPPTLEKVAPSKVQTGGFGDPNGVAVNPRGAGKSNIAAVGSFDLPAGGGSGNGTGGATGARGTVASAGFGNTVAVQAAGRAQAHIQTTTFAVPAAAEEHHAKVADLSNPVPVSIQSKPSPAYTPEARQLRIEGEVLLSVVFTADGHVRILNVVRGLGHGLDEAAQRAAQGVKFSPAMRNGHPVDSNATLHIIFQLS